MLLSIGMMVKNEEKNLDKCLSSVMPLVDNLGAELIIVDTGSEDKTVEISKKYTDKLYFHKWNNDFSAMRNITISYATGDWFFVVDGDEVLADTEEIIKFFKSGEYKNYNAASLNVRSFSKKNNSTKFGDLESIRLFKNDGYFKYVGVVHNQPLYKEPIKKIDSIINHYGYINDDAELMEKKFIRTSTLLKQELLKQPNNIYYRYQLSVSYMMHGDIAEALDEISKAYNAYNKLDNKNKSEHKYILGEYGGILLANKKTKECELMCNKSLDFFRKDEPCRLDLLFYLAKSQSLQGDFANSITNYKKYLDLWEKIDSRQIEADISIKVQTISDYDVAYNDMALMYYELKDYENTIKNILKISNVDKMNRLSSLLINSYINANKIDQIIKLYEENTKNKDNEKTLEKIEIEIENVKLNKDNKKVVDILETKFSQINVEVLYKKLNILRKTTNDSERIRIYDEIIDYEKLNDVGAFYGELIYTAIENDYDISKLINKLNDTNVSAFLDYCNRKYKDFYEKLYDYTEKNTFIGGDNSLNNLRIKIIFTRALLILHSKDEGIYKNVFRYYTSAGIELISKIYFPEVLNDDLLYLINDYEHRFFYYLLKANKIEQSNKIEYIHNLKHALKCNPKMHKGIKIMMNEFKEEEKNINSKYNAEMESLKKMLLENIEVLISHGKYKDALSIIEEYEKSLGKDLEILFYKSDIFNRLNI